MKRQIETKTDSLVPVYTWAEDFRDKQLHVMWTHKELDLGKDIDDIKVNLTKEESALIINILRLFAHYETHVGSFWDVVAKKFPRPEIVSMARLLSSMEVAVHLPFYTNINKELGQHTDEFYESYKDFTELDKRMQFIAEGLKEKSSMKQLAALAFLEGAVLFSSFALLKSFSSNGRNLIPNINAGISMSVRDEVLHCEAAGALFQQAQAEHEEDITEFVHALAEYVFETEKQITALMFDGNTITGITEKQVHAFVQHRCDTVLKNLGLAPIFKPSYNPIADYFYDNVSGYSQHDFFAVTGSQYTRAWDAGSFKWKT